MHILTKILVVLVALLVVALAPLAAVFSTNQQTLKQQAEEAKSSLKTEHAAFEAAKDSYNASVAGLRAQCAEVQTKLAVASQGRDAESAAKGKAEADLEARNLEIARLQGQASAFSQNDTAKIELIKAMQGELEKSRSAYLAAEKARVDLEDQLVRARGDLDTQVATVRQLQEQLQKAGEEKDRAMAEAQRYAAAQGQVGPRAGATADAKSATVVADRSLSATVVSVKREPDSTLAEINAGSRDGVKEGWVMTLADGSNFIGNLRIVKVDVNRAVGQVELEDPQGRGEVKSGQRAIARKGE